MKKITLMFLLFALAFCHVDAQSTINITTSGGSYPGEKWVSITTEADGGGTQVWGQGNGTQCDGSGLINEDIMIAPGTYYVNCYDQYDDGWDSTLISVIAYGNVIGDNGGVSPDDGEDTDVNSACEGTPEELEASFMIVVPNPIIANDDIAAAMAITVDEGFCDGTNTNGDNTAATDSGEGAGSCFNAAADDDVWFTFTVPATTDTVDVSTDFTGGTLVDTEIAVYSGTPGSLVELACSQDDGTTELSNGFSWNSLILDLDVTPGETYYVQVAGYNTNVGTFCLDVSTNQVLGIDEVKDEAAFTYYPNPVQNTLTLNAKNSIENVSIFNILGQEVLRATPNAVNSELDMSSLQDGAYFVKVTIANITKTIKVIKQ